MEKGAEKILAKHGCLYMKDDYKALLEELEAYYKPNEAVKNNAVLPLVSSSNYCKQCKEPIPDGFKFCNGECKQYYYR